MCDGFRGLSKKRQVTVSAAYVVNQKKTPSLVRVDCFATAGQGEARALADKPMCRSLWASLPLCLELQRLNEVAN